jgi:hypothetical protein
MQPPPSGGCRSRPKKSSVPDHELSINACQALVERFGAKKNEEVMSFAIHVAAKGSFCRSTSIGAAETTLDRGDIGPDIRRVALDLQHSLLQVGAVGGTYVVVDNVPAGIRRARCNGNDTSSTVRLQESM